MITKPGLLAKNLSRKREIEKKKRKPNYARIEELTNDCLRAQEQHADEWRRTQVRMSDEKRDAINNKIKMKINRRLFG